MHVTAIGGGAGAQLVLQAVAGWAERRSAVIAVTDTGRSTGLARAISQIPAPGDLRSTIAGLAPEGIWPRLLEHRLRGDVVPQLAGMAMGNLLLGALSELTGDFAQAVELLRQLAATPVEIFPASTVDAQLCAELSDGSLREGELAVRGLDKPPIQRLFLRPAAAAAYPPALAAIRTADLVLIGPGSLFTTLLATLLFDGMREALASTCGQVVYLCNTTTQPGQTDQLGPAEHVARLVELLGPGVLDAVLLNHSLPSEPQRALLAREGMQPLLADPAELARIAALGPRVLAEELLETAGSSRTLWNKQDTIRHDPGRLQQALRALLAGK